MSINRPNIEDFRITGGFDDEKYVEALEKYCDLLERGIFRGCALLVRDNHAFRQYVKELKDLEEYNVDDYREMLLDEGSEYE